MNQYKKLNLHVMNLTGNLKKTAIAVKIKEKKDKWFKKKDFLNEKKDENTSYYPKYLFDSIIQNFRA